MDITVKKLMFSFLSDFFFQFVNTEAKLTQQKISYFKVNTSVAFSLITI